MARPARRRPFLFAALAAAVVLVAAGTWWVLSPKVPGPEAAAALAGDFHAATARLEGNDPAAAEARLAALLADADSVPEELGVSDAAVRNRAVAAVLRVDVASGAAAPEADRPALLPAAGAAVNALRDRVGSTDPAPWYLRSRVGAAAGDVKMQAHGLVTAAGAAPDAAWPHLALYELLSRTDAGAAFPSLAAAYEKAPENVWILLNFAKAAAAEGDPRAVGAFRSLKDRLTPYAAGFRYRQDGGVLPLVDAGLAAAEAGDWPAARRNAALLLNVMRAEEVARADRLDLGRHPLDFVATDLPAAFYDAAGLARAAGAAAIPVAFAPFAGDLAPPRIDGVRDAAAENFDLLGRRELVALTGDAVVIYSRDAGGAWAEALSHPLPAGADYTGLVLADFDLDSDAAPPAAEGRAGPAVGCHDADVDVLLFGPSGVLVFENRLNPDGSRSLVPTPEQAGLNALSGVTDAVAVDLDQEGDLDILAIGDGGVSLWFNRGNLTFEDRTGRSDIMVPAGLAPADLIPIDLDRDVDLDVLVGAAAENGPAAVLENLRHGEFRMAGVPSDGAEPEPAGIEVLDVDGNASWDVAVADAGGVRLFPSVTPAPGRVAWGEPRVISERPADRLTATDHDNDGRTDLFAWGNGGLRLYRNGPGGWADVSGILPDLAEPPTTLAPHDLDGDGDLDLLLVAGGEIRLWENRGGEANRSLSVALLAEFDKDGTDPKRSNHAGLGSLLELRRGPVYQPAAVRGRVTHFGLGPDDGRGAGEALRVLWTNGIPEVILDPESGAVCHPQKLGGSCPYLYSWNGERFAFATDLCWAAPVGLQLAEGVFAPTRAWEHVKLPGELLKPRDGRLELRVTCELWEADYFDEIVLTAVDHPAGTEVFTNEKVGPPELVAPRLYVAEDLKAPAAARVRSGGGGWRDVLETVAVRDENYCRPFREKITQGYTEPWELELDLAGAPRSGAVLLLTGWVFPTDTGLNVALSQNPALPGPRPPQLLMETADGWEAVLPNAGFPGGKTKTIALPLPDFPTDSRRVRLAGTQELYWDRAAWCVPADGAELGVTSAPAELLAAELRYRGFSARSWPASGHGPDRFDYHDVTETPLWPPMDGPFTKYGDARELLTTADDRQAVLGSGDEVALSFRSPPPPPAGWVRDYVVSSVGYDKDANLHTAHGQEAGPLPHAGMTRYPPAPDEPFPAALRDYLDEYQTRPADHRRFWRAVVDAE